MFKKVFTILFTVVILATPLFVLNAFDPNDLDKVTTQPNGQPVSATNTIKATAKYTDTSATTIFQRAIQVILGLSGTVALILTIVGGVQVLISKGNPEAMKKAIGLIIGGAIGILIVVASYTITDFIIKQLTTVTQ